MGTSAHETSTLPSPALLACLFSLLLIPLSGCGDTDLPVLEFNFSTDENGLTEQTQGDSDQDGVPDGSDNCPTVANADQNDLDGDQIGDACDIDVDIQAVRSHFQNLLTQIPSSDWKGSAQKKGAFLNRVEQVARKLDRGFEQQNLTSDGPLIAAHHQLLSVRNQWDGCATQQQPDNDDWLTDCTHQPPVFQRLTDLNNWGASHGPAPCL